MIGNEPVTEKMILSLGKDDDRAKLESLLGDRDIGTYFPYHYVYITDDDGYNILWKAITDTFSGEEANHMTRVLINNTRYLSDIENQDEPLLAFLESRNIKRRDKVYVEVSEHILRITRARLLPKGDPIKKLKYKDTYIYVDRTPVDIDETSVVYLPECGCAYEIEKGSATGYPARVEVEED